MGQDRAIGHVLWMNHAGCALFAVFNCAAVFSQCSISMLSLNMLGEGGATRSSVFAGKTWEHFFFRMACNVNFKALWPVELWWAEGTWVALGSTGRVPCLHMTLQWLLVSCSVFTFFKGTNKRLSIFQPGLVPPFMFFQSILWLCPENAARMLALEGLQVTMNCGHVLFECRVVGCLKRALVALENWHYNVRTILPNWNFQMWKIAAQMMVVNFLCFCLANGQILKVWINVQAKLTAEKWSWYS